MEPHRFTPIPIAPKPAQNPPPPQRELWTDPEKFDLLWSIILSAGLTPSTIPWTSLTIPNNHSVFSARVVVEDIALGKHHITHPTFTPSNVNRFNNDNYNSNYDNNGAVIRAGSKKRRLDGSPKRVRESVEPREYYYTREEEYERNVRTTPSYAHTDSAVSDAASTPPTSSSSPPPPPPQQQPHQAPHQPPPEEEEDQKKKKKNKKNGDSKKTATKTPRRRQRSTSSPPLELDLTNPRITSYLKASGYMNADGTPVKRKRGRPTKDPFGLSVTLKKQLMRMDPNAPPMKKRGRPRKRFLDIDGCYTYGEAGNEDGGSGMVGEDEKISPGLRQAIEKIGEEMDRDVEELLDEGRSMRDTEDDENEEEGSEGDDEDTGDEANDSRPRPAEKMAVDNLVYMANNGSFLV